MKKRMIMCCLFMILLLCLCVTVSAATNSTKTTITTLQEKAEGKIYITWSKKSVDGYQVRWALNSKMTGAKTASFTETEMYRSGLIGGKTYYFQVRTYKKINGKKVYSNWSAMRSIRLKKLPPTTTISRVTALSNSSFEVTWNKKANVKGYQIRYSTDSSFKTKKTASTDGNYMKRKGLAKGTYYVSVRTYNIASDGTKYYSNWSGMKCVTLQEDLQKVLKAASGHYIALRLAGFCWEEFDLKSDGTLIGYFQHSYSSYQNGKRKSAQYTSEIEYRKYSGQFKVVKQIDQYTYELSLQNYQDLTKNEKSYIKDSALYKPIEGSNFTGAKHIYLYLPGTPTSILPSIAQKCKIKGCYLISFDEYCFSRQ